MNHYEPNPHLRRLDQIAEATKQYQESEWRLSFLRTTEAEPPKRLTDEEILLWHNNLQPKSLLPPIAGLLN